jgi:DNA-directed RNA polymerase subunit L
MKKWIIALSVVIVLSVIGIYLFIPSNLSVSTVRGLNCTANGTFQTLSNQSKWTKWFPSSLDTSKYTIDKLLSNTLHITIHSENDTIKSIIQLLPFSPDSTIIQWKCEIPTSNNPFNRIQRYQKAVAIKNDMDEILDHLRSFVEKPQNIYGFDIQRTTFTDTLLMTTKTTLKNYPSISETYQLINLLKDHIAQKNASQTGDPMQNVTPLDTNQFQVMVALPVNKVLADAPPFLFRRMIPGSFMKAEAKGGPQTIKEALRQMQLYFSDHRKTAMAIPFEYLVTDRMAEPDTAKWITRIYAPVY